MQRPLDPLGFKQNRYERPNQGWICGRAAEGTPCPLGPDKHGNCRATGQCVPARKGDRWFCTRSEAQGGKCAEGPLPRGECSHPILPCQPVRSLRRLRSTAVWTLVTLTTGALILLCGSAFRRKWINPGELTNTHATSAAKCSDCHSLDFANRPTMATLGSLEKRGLADSALCLKCHSLGDHPLNPHGVASNSLVALRQNFLKNADSTHRPLLLQLSQKISGLDANSGEIVCVTCHQEHRGRNFDLKRITDAQCQTCHALQFASFASGHPELSRYPYRRRTRIFFDHNSHLHRHFPETKDKAPTSCQDCHNADPSGRFMQVKNFDATCAACHGAQIRGEGMTVKGVAFFTLPGLDVETLSAKGIRVGEWPKFADGKITPFMELLLNRESVTAKAIRELHGVDLLDLSKAPPGQIAAAEQLAWDIKNLLFNLIVEGQDYLLEQIKSQISPAGAPTPAGLAGEISPAVLLAAQKDWMPNLFTEIANYRKGIKPPPPRPATTPQPSPVPTSGKSAGQGDSLLGGESPDSGGDLLGASPMPTPAASGSKNGDLSGGDLLESSAGKPIPTATPSTATTPQSVEPKSAEEWTAAGGWYRPRDSFTIFYRPSGHADTFLAAWLTATAQLAESEPQGSDVFQELANPQTPGVCMKCHTADKIGSKISVNWLPTHPEPNAHPFTAFKHTSHFSLTGDKGCQTCHKLNPDSTYPKYFADDSPPQANRDPYLFQSNFEPMAKALCAECHKPKVAGDGCLLCHQYHTGTFAAKLVGRSKIQNLPAKPDDK